MSRLALLHNATTNIVVIPAPASPMNDVDMLAAKERAGIKGHLQIDPDTGESYGFNAAGLSHVHALASEVRKANPAFRDGFNFRTLAETISKIVLGIYRAKAANAISQADIDAFDTRLSAWLAEETVQRSFYIPCAILPSPATPFKVGPVSFFPLSQLATREQIAPDRLEADHRFGLLVRALRERSASWIAEVNVQGRDRQLGSEVADLAVDIALVAVQLSIPVAYSREVARITGRTMPAWVGSIAKTAGGGMAINVERRDPGFALSADVFDGLLHQSKELLASVGERVVGYLSNRGKLPDLERAWCDAAYWFREGLAEPLDTIAVAKLETAIEVLLSAESTSGSNRRLRQAFASFYGLTPEQPIGKGSGITVKKFVESIVTARSRILHGTLSTLAADSEAARNDVEPLAWSLVRHYTTLLDRYASTQGVRDDTDAFLAWIDAERKRQPPAAPAN